MLLRFLHSPHAGTGVSYRRNVFCGALLPGEGLPTVGCQPPIVCAPFLPQPLPYSPRYTIVQKPNPALHRGVMASDHSSTHRRSFPGAVRSDLGRTVNCQFLSKNRRRMLLVRAAPACLARLRSPPTTLVYHPPHVSSHHIHSPVI